MEKTGKYNDVGDDLMLFKQLVIRHMNYEFMPNFHQAIESVVTKTKTQTKGFS